MPAFRISHLQKLINKLKVLLQLLGRGGRGGGGRGNIIPWPILFVVPNIPLVHSQFLYGSYRLLLHSNNNYSFMYCHLNNGLKACY